ncbi:hypothetical protein BV25DRAFT_1922460 [Artomyces pyxidatus]|uniref:Uncharacterized protein n=1 Tax=Artomyces pyxidatus TaxID=48021 RepID=A0ACB8SDY1_9AGAM|nr:hypothetical protein BV25DRAFT_1922460 [Artomyces pyxidatus]
MAQTTGVAPNPSFGITTFFVLQNTAFRGIYTSWAIVSTIIRVIPDAVYWQVGDFHTAERSLVDNPITATEGAGPTPFAATAAPVAPTAVPESAPPSPQSSTSSIEVVQDFIDMPRGSRPAGGWPVHAVARGRSTGIFHSASEVTALVTGYPNAKAKGFRTELQAEIWLANERARMNEF